jgi:protein required for attachment to host cells
MNTCIVVADGARARFFMLETVEHRPERQRLREVDALTNPEGEETGRELFSNTRSGTNRAPGGEAHEYDDHRERHRQELERRFARHLAESIRDFASSRVAAKVVIAAEPHLLGALRGPLAKTFPSATPLVELAEDLSWHTPERILSVLVRHGALQAARVDREPG